VEALVSIQDEPHATSIVRIREFTDILPASSLLWGALGHVLAKNGDIQEARSILSELERGPSHSHRNPFYAIALIHVALGEYQEATCALERSYELGSLWSFGFRSDPVLNPLREVPEFIEFMQRTSSFDFNPERL
jgi:hypothetical protein